MKQNRQWNQIYWILLLLSAVILVVLLAAQLGRVIQKHQKVPGEETQESTEGQSQEESQTEESQIEESQIEESQIEESQTETTEAHISTEETGYILIGDSHIVVTEGMGYSVYGSRVEGVALNRNLFLVHTGLDPVMGTIEWLEGDGTERVKEIIAEHTEISQWNIICMHGTSMVTMPDIAKRYINHYQKWIDESFQDCHVYIVSVPPLDEKEWVVRHPDMPRRSNEDIIALNTSIQEAFPDNYFDYYDWFLGHGDAFQDEIHYTGDIYCEMFDEIIEAIHQR